VSSAVRLVVLFVLLRRLILFCRLVLFCRFFLPLMFLLLSLFQLLLLLIVFLFELLELLLLSLLKLLLFLLELLLLLLLGFALSLIDLLRPLIDLRRLSLFDLRRSLRIRIALFQLLALLDLLLLDPLALLILFGAKILKFLLVLLFELRIDGARVASVARIVRARHRRTVVVDLAVAWIRGWIARLIRIGRLVDLVRRIFARRRIRRVRFSLRGAIRVALRHVLSCYRRILRWPLAIGISLLDVRPILASILRGPLAHWRRHLNVCVCVRIPAGARRNVRLSLPYL